MNSIPFWLRRFKSIAILGLFIAPSALAQNDRAALEGTVTDSSSAVIAGAKVRITAGDTGQSQERATSSNGTYRFPGLAVGTYTVQVSSDGFKTKIIQNVGLLVGETHTLDVSLSVGEVTDKIEVAADPGPEERSSAESSAVIESDQIQNLPINGRNWAQFTLLAPWAQNDSSGDQRTIRFAGRARDDNNFQIDGVDSTGIQEQAQKSTTRLQISPDAIAEYRVNSALYDATYGNQAGGQVNIVTKSGTNNFHGSLFGYFRNSTFDARQFVDPPQIPPFRLGQYGLTFGGPIVRDKTFFFLSYEGLRQYQGQSTVGFVPTVAEQTKILTQSPALCPILQAFPWRKSAGTINGCAPSHAFPDGQFSPDAADPVTDDFSNIVKATIHEDSWLARIDHKLSAKTNLYFRAQRDIAITYSPNPATPGNTVLDSQAIFNHPGNYVAAAQHLFTTNVFNEFKFGINRQPFHNPQVSAFPLAVNMPSDFTSLNNDSTDNEVGTTFSWLDDLTINHGRHTFRTGIELRRVRLNQGITASNSITFADLAGLESNTLDSIDYFSSWCCRKFRRLYVLPYFQDEWKLRSNLTLNLGIRWEYYGVPNEANNNTTVFDMQNCVTNFNPSLGPGFCPRGSPLTFANYRNWDPRFSFAWAPDRMHGKTVLRGGFGIYHGAAQNDDLNAGLESNNTRFSFSSSDLQTGQSLNFGPGFLQNPPNFGPNGPAYSPIPRSPRALFRHRRDLYVEQWGLTIQHELPSSFLMTASYLGTHGVRLFARHFENVCDPATFQSTGNCVRPLANVGTVDLKRGDGLSSYHGLLLGLQRRISKGWQFQANYTLSHSINDGSVGGGEASAPQNDFCLSCDKGPSIYDIRHNVILSSYYELPFGTGRKYATQGLAGRMLGGWTLSSFSNWHTGHPLTVFLAPGSANVPDGNGSVALRPDLVPGVSLTPPGSSTAAVWINPAAFTTPPINSQTGIFTRYGNAGLGLFRAPNIWQVDLALMKETKLTERFAFELGIQAFNVFNHTQLGDPSSLKIPANCTSQAPFSCSPPPDGGGGFGQINTTANFNINSDGFASTNTGLGLPRQLQFMFRFKF